MSRDLPVLLTYKFPNADVNETGDPVPCLVNKL